MRILLSVMSPMAVRAFRALLPLGLLTTLALGAATGEWQLLCVPAQERLRSAQVAYEGARQAHERQQAAKKAEEDLAEVWQVLPARTEFPKLVLAISELAHQDKVVIPGMTYTFQKVEEGLALKTTMTFRAAGDYAAIRRFIHRLETTGRYLFIESLDATRSSTGLKPSGSTMVVFNVRVVTFLRPDPSNTVRKA